MTISKGDFIEIEYTGKIKDDNIVFDTTDANIARENDLESRMPYGPVTICVGEKQVLPGIDKHLEGKEVGKEYHLDIDPEDAFGKKSAQLIQMIPANKFRGQKIEPMPGLSINIDGITGTIRTVSGGRVMVDFNHPLSGRALHYTVKVNKKVTDDAQKLQSFLQLALGTKDAVVDIKEGKASVTLPQKLPKEAQHGLSDKAKSLISSIKEIVFSESKSEK